MDICAVFFDLRKAFNSVSHRALLQKCSKLDLAPLLFQWLQDYLTGRFQQVAVREAISRLLPVLSGVPQGSILGPLLFIFLIDDICDLPLSKDSTLALYAYDICYSRPICSSEGFAIVQMDIDLIGNWSSSNGLKFSKDKCQWMFISKRSKNPECYAVDLFVNATKLNCVFKVKYLGVLITHDLNWAVYIHSVVSKTRQKLEFPYRKFYKHCNTTVLRKLYVSLIHPNLEYCCIVWDPFTKGSIEHLAAKICLEKWNLSYTTMLRELNLPTLQSRRYIMKLCVVYAILNDSMYFPPGIFVYRNSSISIRTNTPLCLQPVHCSTNYLMFSFVPHSMLLWNSLPPCISGSASLLSFKRALHVWL